ncbi:hypothetical protein HDU92_001056 [Lobulomyces angularis]|nr:hypothetical protein HDU92_001056 [Lobulomyces angularis]
MTLQKLNSIRTFPFTSNPKFKPPGVVNEKISETPAIFTPFTIKSVTLKNRIGVAPMCTYSSVNGLPNSFHLVHLGQFAVRGAGLITVEATGVTAAGRISPHCLGIWSNEHRDAFKPIVEFIHSQRAVAAIQLAHAGRKASGGGYYTEGRGFINDVKEGGWPDEVVGPSAVQDFDYLGQPKEITLQGIEDIKEAFSQAARRADEAGFDVIELHGAHGYLIHSFLSPISNKRTDHYGGSFENRTRFLLETIREVKKFWPADKPIFVRLSASDWLETVLPDSSEEFPLHWDLKQTVRLARLLRDEGVDVISVSSGGTSPKQTVPFFEQFNTQFSYEISKEITTSVAGNIRLPSEAEEIIKSNKASIVLLAREFLKNPNWVLDALVELNNLKEKGDEGKKLISWPSQYERSLL